MRCETKTHPKDLKFLLPWPKEVPIQVNPPITCFVFLCSRRGGLCGWLQERNHGRRSASDANGQPGLILTMTGFSRIDDRRASYYALRPAALLNRAAASMRAQRSCGLRIRRTYTEPSLCLRRQVLQFADRFPDEGRRTFLVRMFGLVDVVTVTPTSRSRARGLA